jgi:hypothetical protein
MTTKTKTKTKTETETEIVCAPPARLLALIQRPDTEYMGACVVQGSGGWSRLGPTWWTVRGWVCWGPGLARWQTTEGLAELVSQTSATPKYHANGWTCAPLPNMVFYVEDHVIDHLAPVPKLLAAVEKEFGVSHAR